MKIIFAALIIIVAQLLIAHAALAAKIGDYEVYLTTDLSDPNTQTFVGDDSGAFEATLMLGQYYEANDVVKPTEVVTLSSVAPLQGYGLLPILGINTPLYFAELFEPLTYAAWIRDEEVADVPLPASIFLLLPFLGALWLRSKTGLYRLLRLRR